MKTIIEKTTRASEKAILRIYNSIEKGFYYGETVEGSDFDFSIEECGIESFWKKAGRIGAVCASDYKNTIWLDSDNYLRNPGLAFSDKIY